MWEISRGRGKKEWAESTQSVRVPTGDGKEGWDGRVGEPAIPKATQCCPPVSYLGQTLKRKALWGRGKEWRHRWHPAIQRTK